MDSNSSPLIHKLKKDIEVNEKYIKYLGENLLGYQEEIADLKKQNTEAPKKTQFGIRKSYIEGRCIT